MIARKYIVKGRVQGVGFRYFVEREARQIGVVGWVRNTEDGTVECLAAGTEAQIEALRSKLEKGPRASRVDSVVETEVHPEEAVGSLKEFSIQGAW